MAEQNVPEMTPGDLARRLDAGEVQIVDVRTDEEWAEGRIAGSRHVVLDELPAVAESIGRERPVVFVCSGGTRSATAAEAFRVSGYEAFSLGGGLKAWSAEGHELETG